MTQLFRDIAEAPEPHALTRGVWRRRAVVMVLSALVALALSGRFGQMMSSSSATGPAATLALDAPRVVRGGLFFESRIDVRALGDIEHPRIVLDPGWLEGMQVNSIEPDPVSEASRDGRVVLSYDSLRAGDRLVVWLQFEVNPTNLGRHSYGVELDDAERPVARLSRTLTVLP